MLPIEVDHVARGPSGRGVDGVADGSEGCVRPEVTQAVVALEVVEDVAVGPGEDHGDVAVVELVVEPQERVDSFRVDLVDGLEVRDDGPVLTGVDPSRDARFGGVGQPREARVPTR